MESGTSAEAVTKRYSLLPARKDACSRQPYDSSLRYGNEGIKTMANRNIRDWQDRRDEIILACFAVIVALMFAPALLGVL